MALVIIATLSGCGGGASKDASAVEKLLEQQMALAKAGDWQGLYNTYSPRYQSRCPYEALLRRAADSDSASSQSLSYDQLHVQVDGDTAYVTYVTMRSGEVVASVTDAAPDLYVKIDGTWFDEYDELATCASSAPPGSEGPST
ncbi:MAG: hypothetical protein EPO22_03440 [Dehalococcoidia bacterium]|nr:MAG: hypothetical protein EPO22_03440 [Dehalococcoidia bacterium]